MSRQIHSGAPFNTEILNYSRDGEQVWVRLQGQPVFNKNGELTGFLALEEDITQERELNARNKESENRLLRALEKIGDNVWEHNFVTGTTYYSKPHNEMLGLNLQHEQLHNAVWWSNVHAEDLPKLQEVDRRCRTGELDSRSLEYRILRQDGSVRWVLDRGTVIEKDKLTIRGSDVLWIRP